MPNLLNSLATRTRFSDCFGVQSLSVLSAVYDVMMDVFTNRKCAGIEWERERGRETHTLTMSAVQRNEPGHQAYDETRET